VRLVRAPHAHARITAIDTSRAEAEPGVVLVTGPGGRGMTCSPAIAEETFR